MALIDPAEMEPADTETAAARERLSPTPDLARAAALASITTDVEILADAAAGGEDAVMAAVAGLVRRTRAIDAALAETLGIRPTRETLAITPVGGHR